MKSDLVVLAREVGIQSGYVDMAGVRREASAGTLLAMLGVMGIELAGEGEAGEALRGWRAARLGRWLEPVQVHW
jgi:(1->4)-alpha-D-glucan 1-alpha-D-glucosylmutase